MVILLDNLTAHIDILVYASMIFWTVVWAICAYWFILVWELLDILSYLILLVKSIYAMNSVTIFIWYNIWSLLQSMTWFWSLMLYIYIYIHFKLIHNSGIFFFHIKWFYCVYISFLVWLIKHLCYNQPGENYMLHHCNLPHMTIFFMWQMMCPQQPMT